MPAGLARRRAIIVGAGQSGLAVAAALSAEGLQPQQDFVVIDAAAPGQRSWSSRWHSMVLLSDARHSALPTRRHPGDQRLHPRVDEMVDYLKTAGLMMQKIPEQLELMDSLPRTPTGKVLKATGYRKVVMYVKDT